MVSESIKSGLHFATSAIGVVAATLSTHASAINVTLPTTNIQANAQYSFGSDTQDLMQSLGINVRALGNSVQSSPGVWSYSMPVTDVSLSMSLFPLSATPTAGHASGSALSIYSGKGELQLGNFALDFGRNVLMADLTTVAGTTKNFDVYEPNFKPMETITKTQNKKITSTPVKKNKCSNTDCLCHKTKVTKNKVNQLRCLFCGCSRMIMPGQ